jgi:vacuolar-type H+-ATPase subunit F/Vma7
MSQCDVVKMQGEIIAVGTKNFALGFHSAGISKYLATEDAEKAKSFINENLETAAIVLVGESLAGRMLEHIEDITLNRTLPSIVILRDEQGTTGMGYTLLEKSVEKATGINLLAREGA